MSECLQMKTDFLLASMNIAKTFIFFLTGTQKHPQLKNVRNGFISSEEKKSLNLKKISCFVQISSLNPRSSHTHRSKQLTNQICYLKTVGKYILCIHIHMNKFSDVEKNYLYSKNTNPTLL